MSVKNRSILYTEADPTDDDIANGKTTRVTTTYNWVAETMSVQGKTYTYAVMNSTTADDWRSTFTQFTVDALTTGRQGTTNVKNRSILYTEADPTDDATGIIPTGSPMARWSGRVGRRGMYQPAGRSIASHRQLASARFHLVHAEPRCPAQPRT